MKIQDRIILDAQLKIEYLKQENEFVKKNIQMDREANGEYKRNHPSNSNLSKK